MCSVAEWNRLRVDNRLAVSRQRQHVVDQLVHPSEGLLCVREVAGVTGLDGHLDAGGGDVQRVAKVVTDDAGELVESFVLALDPLVAFPTVEFVAHPLGQQLDERRLGVREGVLVRIGVGKTEGPVQVAVGDHLPADVRAQSGQLVRLRLRPPFGFGVVHREQPFGVDRPVAVRLRERTRRSSLHAVVVTHHLDHRLDAVVDRGEEPQLDTEPFPADP